MIQSESDRLHKLIDSNPLKLQSVRELHNIVDEFLSQDINGISLLRKNVLELDFQKRRILSYCYISVLDRDRVNIILDDLERVYFNKLDKSVDYSKSKPSLWEKCIGAFKAPLNLGYFKK
ncbi:hypothetical protein V7O61_06390 [Methanolobus sp. WCC1]|uniref:hypothetical protein n=1 Tax=unclassified Methanolobus TaxID=2629569 RepID=UPI003253E07C